MRRILAAALLACLCATPARAGNGYITTCEGVGCYGKSSLCFHRVLANGNETFCYWP
jgi:hypothetical protein